MSDTPKKLNVPEGIRVDLKGLNYHEVYLQGLGK